MSSTNQGPIAVISDIHGNRWALESVLEDVERRGIRVVVNLGDCFYGPLDPAGTADILTPLGLLTVRGNEDRLLCDTDADSRTLHFVRDRLSPAHIDWLKTLPLRTFVFDEVCLCHGTPYRDDEYLLHVVTSAGVRRKTSDELSATLREVSSPVVLCGHDHVPAVKRLNDNRLILNPGSVGLPAYADDVPFPHRMETGKPHARYALLYRTAGGWQTEHIAVTYDHAAAAGAAEKNGRSDWSAWLRTGSAAT